MLDVRKLDINYLIKELELNKLQKRFTDLTKEIYFIYFRDPKNPRVEELLIVRDKLKSDILKLELELN